MKKDLERSDKTMTESDRKKPPVYLGVMLVFAVAWECLALYGVFFEHKKGFVRIVFLCMVLIARLLALMTEKFRKDPWGDTVFAIFNYGVFARLRGLQRSLIRLCIAGVFLLLTLVFVLFRVGQTRDLVRTNAVVDGLVHNFQYRVKFQANGETQFAFFPAAVFSPHYQASIPVAYDLDNPRTAYPVGKAALYGGPMEIGLLGMLVLMLSGYPAWLIRVCLRGRRQEESHKILWEDETDE